MDESPKPAFRRSRLGVLALVGVVAAYAALVHGNGANQGSHYALVKALAAGTATVDRTRFEIGDVGTPDLSYFEGHWYSNKAPGLALLVTPLYKVLAAAGYPSSGDPARMLWALGLLGTVLPTAVLLLLVYGVAERLQPGFGAVTATILGLGTLLFPFGSMFFAHALSTCLGFAAFVILWRERERPARLRLVAVAGLLAGLAVTVEYPLAIVGAAAGLYAVTRPRRVRRALAFAGGALAGVAPLLAYNTWAFGSPTHLSYTGSVSHITATPDVPRAKAESFLRSIPDFETGIRLLLSKWGLLATAPVLAVGAAGLVLVYRRGSRIEAAIVAGMAAVYTVWLSGFGGPWGGVPPGPRYFAPLLPFLVVPLAVVLRTAPLVAGSLAAGSILVLSTITATRPLAAFDGHVLDRLTSPALEGWSPTVPDLVGITGWYDVLPLVAAFLGALAAAVLATPWPRLRAADACAAALAVAGWVALARGVSRLLEARTLDPDLAGAVVLAATLALAAAVVLVELAPRLSVAPRRVQAERTT